VALAIVALLLAGCGQSASRGVVDGSFSLPGRPAADLQRGGLNFSGGIHGKGHGTTTRVSADGTYTVMLRPGTYSVIGALSGHAGGPAPETCAATMNVVVKANSTTHADYVCDATPVPSSKP
jgi:hypothetical protein